MSIASRINEITNHLTDDWQSIQNIGGDTSIDNNIENISQALEDLYDEMPKVSSSGTDLSLNDTRKGRLSLDLKGNTYQKTLPSEYQAVDYIESSGTQYIDTGYVPNINTKVKYKFSMSDVLTNQVLLGSRTSGTYQTSTNQFYVNIFKETPGTPNYKTFTPTLDNQVEISSNTIYEFEATSKNTFTTATQNIYLFCLNNAGSIAAQATAKLYSCKIYDNNTLVRNFIPCYRNSDNEVGLYDLVNDTFYTNAGTGVFTYGTTTSIPNPDIPIPINVVSGDNEIKVEGKNLFDKNTCLFHDKQRYNDNGVIVNDNDSSYSDLIKVKPNTIYTISNLNGIPGKSVRVAFFVNNQTFIERTTIASSNNITITTTSSTYYLSIQGRNLDNMDINTIQMEYGNQATTYTPYQSQTYPINLGNMELCKIGDYQDYIYKDNGKWYKYEMIGKYIFKGDSAEQWHAVNTTDGHYYGVLTPYSTIYNSKISNLYKFDSRKSGFATLSNNTFGIETNRIIHIMDNRINGLNALKNELAVNNLIVYYPLETPTGTEITDTTLINQLNNIYKAQSYNEQTNISQTNNDLPFIINASALKEWSE